MTLIAIHVFTNIFAHLAKVSCTIDHLTLHLINSP